MKALVTHGFDSYQTVRFEDMPDPRPDSGEIVLEVEASEVNYPDILQIEGKYQVRAPRPFVPGLGAIGRVIEVAKGVKNYNVGQRVLTLPGGTSAGTHAERVKVHERYCFEAPEDVPADVGAALGLTYQTSYTSLITCAAFQPGENVLVLGATGGIGMAAVQLARAFGAGTVIAATRGAEGMGVAREIGADHVIDCAGDDMRDRQRDQVMAATEGSGVDVVIDPVGGPIGEAAVRTLAWRGRFVVVGFTSGQPPSFKGNYLLIKGISVMGMQWTEYQSRFLSDVRTAQDHIFDLWRQGKLSPRISRQLPLSRGVEALDLLSQGRARGKIILRPNQQEEE